MNFHESSWSISWCGDSSGNPPFFWITSSQQDIVPGLPDLDPDLSQIYTNSGVDQILSGELSPKDERSDTNFSQQETLFHYYKSCSSFFFVHHEKVFGKRLVGFKVDSEKWWKVSNFENLSKFSWRASKKGQRMHTNFTYGMLHVKSWMYDAYYCYSCLQSSGVNSSSVFLTCVLLLSTCVYIFVEAVLKAGFNCHNRYVFVF